MAVTISFSSKGNPPSNISTFNIYRSVRPASGTITSALDLNNVSKIATVTFTGAPPSNNALIGDQMHINGLLYRITANTSTTITFTSDTNLSTITSFPASFIILNDLAEFGSFDFVGTVSPTLPFSSNLVHQFTDNTGTIFDFYNIKTIDSGGNVSADYIGKAFRPGQVVTIASDDARTAPKDDLSGVIGGSITFEVEVIMAGKRQDPKDNYVVADIYQPSYVSKTGVVSQIDQIVMTRVGQGKYRGTWNCLPTITNGFGQFQIYACDEYFVSYRGNFYGLLNATVDSLVEFDSELFSIRAIEGQIMGRFPAYATIEDLRLTFFNIDSYLPESIDKTNLDARNRFLQYHLERASDKLREELNFHQLHSNSSDRREYVATRAIYTIMMASRGQNGSAVATEMLKEWKDRFEDILAQLKRENISSSNSIPIGRG